MGEATPARACPVSRRCFLLGVSSLLLRSISLRDTLSTGGSQDPGPRAKFTVALSWAGWPWGTAFSAHGRQGLVPQLVPPSVAQDLLGVCTASPARPVQAEPRETAVYAPEPACWLSVPSEDPWLAGPGEGPLGQAVPRTMSS